VITDLIRHTEETRDQGRTAIEPPHPP